MGGGGCCAGSNCLIMGQFFEIKYDKFIGMFLKRYWVRGK